MKYKILIIDDDIDFCGKVKDLLITQKRDIKTALDGSEALELINSWTPHLILLDEHLPDMSGIELIEKIKAVDKKIIIIIVTGTKSVKLAVDAIKKGAYHFINKPFNITELKNIIKIALDKIELQVKLDTIEKQNISLDTPDFIGETKEIIEIKNKINTLKGHQFSSLLITGETGTGKGSMAKYIHFLYENDMTNFVHISCADIAPNLLETELFGYEKGAFTDAKKNKHGLFELADEGTLFLDEIDSTSMALQSKLLHFLDTQKIRKVGATTETKVNVRLIAATNANLDKLVEEKNFRKDLFYRLNMINFHIPPLRERKDDIEKLANHFRQVFNLTFSKNIVKISDGAIKILKKHDWPGNTRELKNVIENAMIFCRNNVIEKEDLNIRGCTKSDSVNQTNLFPKVDNIKFSEENIVTLKELESLYIDKVLAFFDENRTETAKALGISRATLINKIKEIR